MVVAQTNRERRNLCSFLKISKLNEKVKDLRLNKYHSAQQRTVRWYVLKAQGKPRMYYARNAEEKYIYTILLI